MTFTELTTDKLLASTAIAALITSVFSLIVTLMTRRNLRSVEQFKVELANRSERYKKIFELRAELRKFQIKDLLKGKNLKEGSDLIHVVKDLVPTHFEEQSRKFGAMAPLFDSSLRKKVNDKERATRASYKQLVHTLDSGAAEHVMKHLEDALMATGEYLELLDSVTDEQLALLDRH